MATVLAHPARVRAASRRLRGEPFVEAVSSREIEVLQLIANGLGNREIARVLFVSDETVKTHVQRVLRKLNANGRAHAVAIAIRHGLIA
jgi:DNA-binding NarL/FixJ family response regulator